MAEADNKKILINQSYPSDHAIFSTCGFLACKHSVGIFVSAILVVTAGYEFHAAWHDCTFIFGQISCRGHRSLYDIRTWIVGAPHGPARIGLYKLLHTTRVRVGLAKTITPPPYMWCFRCINLGSSYAKFVRCQTCQDKGKFWFGTFRPDIWHTHENQLPHGSHMGPICTRMGTWEHSNLTGT